MVIFKCVVLLFYFSDRSSVPSNVPFALGTLLGTALLEIITAICLLRLKNWASQMSLRIATISLCAFATAATLREPHPSWDFTSHPLRPRRFLPGFEYTK